MVRVEAFESFGMSRVRLVQLQQVAVDVTEESGFWISARRMTWRAGPSSIAMLVRIIVEQPVSGADCASLAVLKERLGAQPELKGDALRVVVEEADPLDFPGRVHTELGDHANDLRERLLGAAGPNTGRASQNRDDDDE